MRNSLPLFICGLLICVPCAVHAAPYEFTLEGTVTYSLFGSNPAVGETCTITYIADTEDFLPSNPETGSYYATSPTVRFSDSTPALVFEPAEEIISSVALWGTAADLEPLTERLKR